jgi:hypothetical protein
MKAGSCLGALLALAVSTTSVAFAEDAPSNGNVATGPAGSEASPAKDVAAPPIDTNMAGGKGRAINKAHEAVTNLQERLFGNAKLAKPADAGPSAVSPANQKNGRQAVDRLRSPAGPGPGKELTHNAIGASTERSATQPPTTAAGLAGRAGGVSATELPVRSRDMNAHGIAVAPVGGPSINGTVMTRPGSGTGTPAVIGGLTKTTVGTLNGATIRPKHP